ncbi:hypothetical protein [Dongia sp.]|uniref:hypothetical protein n=1 Tax=Dongia sp. TaxID=1977262 RepID=UPI0037515AE3
MSDRVAKPSSEQPIAVVFPPDETVVRVPVEAGDTVILPFGPEVMLEAKEGSGNLAFRGHGDTVILQGFAKAVEDLDHPVIVETSDGKPLDVALVLAMTDPNLGVQVCGYVPEPPVFYGGGGIYQPFEGGVTLHELAAIGRQDDTAGLLAAAGTGQ